MKLLFAGGSLLLSGKLGDLIVFSRFRPSRGTWREAKSFKSRGNIERTVVEVERWSGGFGFRRFELVFASILMLIKKHKLLLKSLHLLF